MNASLEEQMQEKDKMVDTEQLMNELVADFAKGLTDIVRDAVTEALEDAKNSIVKNGVVARSGKGKGKAMNGTKWGNGKRPPRAHGRKKGQKRTPEQIAKDAKAVLKVIKKNPDGIRVEGLRDALSMDTRDLKVPINHLLEEGKITYDGVARGTHYYPA